MKQRAKTDRRIAAAPAAESLSVQDFEQLASDEGVSLEHLTIPGFLRRIPHKWHIDEITRFGDKVGRAAEAMQLSYITTIDRCLGVIRVFPRPLLERVYALMAPQLSWPRIVDVPELEDGKRAKMEEIRRNEKLAAQLADLISATDDPKVVEAATVLVSSIEEATAALKQEAPAAVAA